MRHVRFTLPTGREATLRPVLAAKLLADAGEAPTVEHDGSWSIAAAAIAEAARRVRETYRCRDARRDLRLCGLLAVEGVADRMPVAVTFPDHATRLEAQRAVATAPAG